MLVLRNGAIQNKSKRSLIMRELTMCEMRLVAGAGDGCSGDTPADTDGSPNTYSGISNTTTVGEDIINVYEGLVEATSHIIERVANAL